ncbi:arginine repressor [Scatolibacter rhodanostii]|uniref:arginine repressor n=1 Tax=Scatolibacter rhodanostii TaxID=2014781 RepID=UPI000C0862B1|nr:arginine repressor [Scatolibacter rhodanostii]
MKTRRHAKILEIIKEMDVDTQEELLKYLRDAGFDITQATVSRDIKELRLVKTLSRSGKYRYSTGNESVGDISSKFYTLFADSVNSVESAQNMVVIKTLTGMAQAVCAAMDSMPWQNFIGTLAGDDTIFVVCRNESAALETQEEFRKLIING